MKRNDCVVVFQDDVERMRCVDVKHCFGGLCHEPLVLVKEGDATGGSEIPTESREQIIGLEPKDHSIWLLNEETKHYECVGSPESDSKSLMSDYFRTALLRRFRKLVELLQKLGVKSFKANASEVEDSQSFSELAAKLKGSVEGGIAKGDLSVDVAKSDALSFLHKVKQEIYYSSVIVDVPVAEMERRAREFGFENETIVKMVIQAKKNGSEAWKSLKLSHAIDVDEMRKANEKFSFALDLGVKLGNWKEGVAASAKATNEMMTHLVLGMKIEVSNL